MPAQPGQHDPAEVLEAQLVVRGLVLIVTVDITTINNVNMTVIDIFDITSNYYC